MTGRVACLLAAAALVASSAAWATDRQTLASALVESLGATPTSCEAMRLPEGFGPPVACASTDRGWGKIKKAFRKLGRESDPHGMGQAGGKREGLRVRYTLTSDGPAAVVFDDDRRVLAVAAGHPCWGFTTLDELRSLSGDAWASLASPLRVEKTRPRYPEEARRQGAGGGVVLHLLIARDGTVVDACVVSTSSPGLGFESAALEAVHQWRYEAIEKPTVALVTLDWSVSLKR